MVKFKNLYITVIISIIILYTSLGVANTVTYEEYKEAVDDNYKVNI